VVKNIVGAFGPLAGNQSTTPFASGAATGANAAPGVGSFGVSSSPVGWSDNAQTGASQYNAPGSSTPAKVGGGAGSGSPIVPPTPQAPVNNNPTGPGYYGATANGVPIQSTYASNAPQIYSKNTQGIMVDKNGNVMGGGGASMNNGTVSGVVQPNGGTQTNGTQTNGTQTQSNGNQSTQTGDQGTPGTFPGYVTALGTMAGTSTPQFQQGAQTYNQALQGLQSSKLAEAGQEEQNSQNPVPMNFMAGKNAAIQGEQLAQQNAYAGTMTGAAAQEAAATGQQDTQQQGLAQAGGLYAPTAAGQYGLVYPGAATPNASGYAGYGATGGPAGAGAVNTQVSQGAAVQNMSGMLAQATGLAGTVTQAMQDAGYNPVSGAGPANEFANGVKQWFEKGTGNAKYGNVANLLGEVASKYAAILQQAGTPTKVDTVQNQIIDGLMSQQSINTILSDLQQNAQTSIDKLNIASQSNATGGSSSGDTQTTGGFTYVQNADGSWSPK
jgi:hypothetical protein